MAVAFAARNPDRVKALVLFNALGASVDPKDIDFAIEVQNQAWGTEAWVPVIAPSVVDDPAESVCIAKMMRATATPQLSQSKPELWQGYSRKEVHDIFAPDTSFTPGEGGWEILGIVRFRGDLVRSSSL